MLWIIAWDFETAIYGQVDTPAGFDPFEHERRKARVAPPSWIYRTGLLLETVCCIWFENLVEN
jgi:hypothetical protein